MEPDRIWLWDGRTGAYLADVPLSSLAASAEQSTGTLAPGSSIAYLPDGRVTLNTLWQLKANWGVAIKALVTRTQHLGHVNPDQARSLYKQISARGWNKAEPVWVSNEQAIWLERAIAKRMKSEPDPIAASAHATALGRSYFDAWINWSPEPGPVDAEIVDLASRRGPRVPSQPTPGVVRQFPSRR
jgi:hypothetical protein